MNMPGRSFLGALDARPFEEQSEVRTWTTGALSEPTEWTGEVNAEVWVSSTAKDTDVQVTLSEVRPDGKETYVQSGWLRASVLGANDGIISTASLMVGVAAAGAASPPHATSIAPNPATSPACHPRRVSPPRI